MVTSGRPGSPSTVEGWEMDCRFTGSAADIFTLLSHSAAHGWLLYAHPAEGDLPFNLALKSTLFNPLLLVPKLSPDPQVPLGLSLAVSKPKYLFTL